MVRTIAIHVLPLIMAATVCPAKGGVTSSQLITGKVTDLDNNPVIGASVVFYVEGQMFSGCATDSQGIFVKKLAACSCDSLVVKVSSVGFEPQTALVLINRSHEATILGFQLEQRLVEVGAVKVRPKERQPRSAIPLRHKRIVAAAARSLVPTNPISAIKQPQVVREGSNHSSKIIVNGSQPEYYINGVEIGSNPNHYGVFLIIPAPVVEGMTFHPHGTGSPFGSPSVVELSTGRPFEKHAHGEINLSLVEATGSFSFGNPRYFILGSLRKSVLDKLVKQFDIRTGRRTLPPTNFQDLFVSSGLNLGGRHYLLLDQYHVRDFLSYSTGATDNNPNGVRTFLHTAEHYLGARWRAVYDKVLVDVRMAVRSSHEEYAALSAPGAQTDRVKLDLRADRRANLGNVELSFPLGRGLLTVGNQLEYLSRSDVQMTQRSWNFLPPDANSDNPFIYQTELNQLCATYTGSRRELNNAAYASVTQSLSGIQFETGVRAQYFRNLNSATALLFRNRVTVKAGETIGLSFFLGSFAENPRGKILEAYQVLIHSDRGNLKPIITKLVSADFSIGKVDLGLFAKRIDNQPVPVPDFACIAADGSVGNGFITVQPDGRLAFYGGDITFELDSFLSPKLDLYAFYGYSHGEKTVSGVRMPYELNSPHKLFAQATYRLSRVVSITGEGGLRSGFPFTSTRSYSVYHNDDRFNNHYYESVLGTENRARFPVNATLNAHVSFDLGSSQLFFSVANLTDRSNPIINTSGGFVYDAGILPSVGFRRRF